MESGNTGTSRPQTFRRELLTLAALIIFAAELLWIVVQGATLRQAILNGLVSMALAVVLVEAWFRFGYRLLPSEQHRWRELFVLLDIATAVSSTLDLTRMLQIIARRTAEACQVHRCSIFLLDEGGQRILPLMSQYASGHTDRQLWELFRYHTYAQRVSEVPPLVQVVEQRQPLVLDESGVQRLPEAWIKPFGIRALLVVPLVARDRAMGFMALDHIEPKRFAPEQIHLATTIASQVAAALENARLFQQVSDKAQRLALLAEISTAVTSTLELDAILDAAAAGLCRMFGVEQCGVIIFEPSSQMGRLVAEYPRRDTLSPVTIPLTGNGSVERIMASKRPLAIEDAQHDPLLASVRDTMQQRQVQSILLVPLLVKGQVIGTIGLDSLRQRRVFTSEEMELAQTIANQIAVAIDNARLYQQTLADISRLKEVDELKSQIVANVSHELRVPLASIKAYTELLQTNADGGDAELRRSWLAVIDRETAQLSTMVSDSLNLARLEAGHFELELEPLQLAPLLAEVVAGLQVQADQRGIAIEIQSPSELPSLWADADLLKSAARNLIANAIKFSRDGGRVSVSVWQDGPQLKFAVQDEGIGIPAESMPHLFSKFYRVPGSGSNIEGTGLGLALAKEAIVAHGGQIDAESTSGRGSRFTVTIPLTTTRQ